MENMVSCVNNRSLMDYMKKSRWNKADNEQPKLKDFHCRFRVQGQISKCIFCLQITVSVFP